MTVDTCRVYALLCTSQMTVVAGTWRCFDVSSFHFHICSSILLTCNCPHISLTLTSLQHIADIQQQAECRQGNHTPASRACVFPIMGSFCLLYSGTQMYNIEPFTDVQCWTFRTVANTCAMSNCPGAIMSTTACINSSNLVSQLTRGGEQWSTIYN